MLKLIIILAALAVCYGFPRVLYSLNKKSGLHISLNGRGQVPHFFNATEKTIFLIHGYTGSSDLRFNQLVREAIFDYRNPEDYNVIEVDWTNAAGNSYTQARNSAYAVAVNLANLIRWLTDSRNSQQIGIAPHVAVMHLVGFDLGAHIAGIAGRLLHEDSKRIGRITGLDPSGRRWGVNSDRLRQGDASYVEVIHTDTSGLLAQGIGDPIGDINFYANGGSNQPGCLTHSCNHDRAFELFAASLINPFLAGRECNSKTQMQLNICRGNFLQLGGLQLSKFGLRICRINTSRGYPFL